MRADQAIGLAESHGWNRRSCGNGSKGRRLYCWAWIATISPRHQLLVRRKISDPRELAYYIAYVPDHYVCSLTDLVKVADARWAIEDDFQDAKQSVALDQTQVRGYRAWKRHTALALAAYALLAVASALAKAAHPRPVLSEDPDQQAPADCGMTAPAVPEIRRLLTTTRRTPVNQHNEFHVAWSDWRRRHQARARWHHYRTRLALTARPSVKRAAHRKAGTSGKIVEARRSGRCIVDDVNAGMGAGTDERQFGPWDVSEAGDRGNEKFRLALGGLVIRGVPGMTVKLEVHDARAIAVTLVLGDSLMQLQAYTALAISSRWRTVRAEILENLRQVGVAADEVRGCLGDEVIAYGVAGDTAYPARFVGYDGPGWLLRGVFRGPAALDQDVADTFERLFRDTIVVPDGQSRAERSVFVLRPPNVDRPIGPPRPPLRWVGGED